MRALRSVGHRTIPPATLRLYFAMLQFHRDHGYPATVKELMAAVRVTGPAGVISHLKKLIELGLVVKEVSSYPRGGVASRGYVPVGVKLVPPSAFGPTADTPPSPESLP